MGESFKTQFNAYLHYIVVNQKFELVHKYLDNGKFNELINHALDYMNGHYPIRNILYLPYDDEFQSQLNIVEKQKFIITILEYFYNYAKNLLWNFDIYKSKTITFDSQQLKEIMQIPHYQTYLHFIDYEYVKGKEEWKLKSSVLKNGQKHDLICATIWCCVAVQYFSESIHIWKLNEFKNDVDSLVDLCNQRNCETCGKNIDIETFCCSMCRTSVKKMQFYLKWEYNKHHGFVESLALNETIYQKSLLNNYNYTRLTYTQPEDDSDDVLNFDTRLHDLTNYDYTNLSYTDNDESYCELYEDKKNSDVISKGINFTDITNGDSNLLLWTCKCSFMNKPTQMNCEACLSNKPEISEISNNKSNNEKNTIVNNKNSINNQSKDVDNFIKDLSISKSEKNFNSIKVSKSNPSNNEKSNFSDTVTTNKKVYKTFKDTEDATNKPQQNDENRFNLFCCWII